jgi:hypothetical protein
VGDHGRKTFTLKQERAIAVEIVGYIVMLILSDPNILYAVAAAIGYVKNLGLCGIVRSAIKKDRRRR